MRAAQPFFIDLSHRGVSEVTYDPEQVCQASIRNSKNWAMETAIGPRSMGPYSYISLVPTTT